MKENISKFQFDGYKVTKSLIVSDDVNNLDDLVINFDLKGEVITKENKFILNFNVNIRNDNSEIFKIDIDSIGIFRFSEEIQINSNENNINPLFYINAPAILFPYIRAYISTLTNLSDIKTINLPTLNLISLAEKLKSNIEVLDFQSE